MQEIVHGTSSTVSLLLVVTSKVKDENSQNKCPLIGCFDRWFKTKNLTYYIWRKRSCSLVIVFKLTRTNTKQRTISYSPQQCAHRMPILSSEGLFLISNNWLCVAFCSLQGKSFAAEVSCPVDVYSVKTRTILEASTYVTDGTKRLKLSKLPSHSYSVNFLKLQACAIGLLSLLFCCCAFCIVLWVMPKTKALWYFYSLPISYFGGILMSLVLFLTWKIHWTHKDIRPSALKY